jgi:hypothetical protein
MAMNETPPLMACIEEGIVANAFPCIMIKGPNALTQTFFALQQSKLAYGKISLFPSKISLPPR